MFRKELLALVTRRTLHWRSFGIAICCSRNREPRHGRIKSFCPSNFVSLELVRAPRRSTVRVKQVLFLDASNVEAIASLAANHFYAGRGLPKSSEMLEAHSGDSKVGAKRPSFPEASILATHWNNGVRKNCSTSEDFVIMLLSKSRSH